MKILDYIKEAEQRGTAVGHFNVSNIEMFWAVVNAGKSLNLPVIIGVSEGERKFFGLNQVIAIVKSLREKENLPIFVNADHTFSVELSKTAIDAGCDSVIFDGATLPIDENIRLTRECVEYANGRGVLVEGELGYIGKSSRMLDDVPDGIEMTSIEDAKRYVTETGVQLFAPAVGNIHGMIDGVSNPSLDIERIKSIKDAVGVPLVLHGGSGISDSDFTSAIKAGISVVHISTEMRVAYKNALKQALQEDEEELAPYKYMKDVVSAVEKVVSDRLKLFNSL